MANHCKICGSEVNGRNKYCDDCKKAKKREYFNKKYNNDDSFRVRHLNRIKTNKESKEYLGSLYDFSHHMRSNFEDEERIVKSMKKRIGKGRKSKSKDDSFGYKANKNYNQAKAYEEQVLENQKTCEICGGTDFEVADGMVICCTCGLCEEVFSMSVFGKKELSEDNLSRAMKNHYKGLKGGQL